LSKFLASKEDCPVKFPTLCRRISEGLPTGYKFKVTNANIKVRDVALVGADRMDTEQLAKSVAPLKGTDYLRSDVAIVWKKTCLPFTSKRIFEVRDN